MDIDVSIPDDCRMKVVADGSLSVWHCSQQALDATTVSPITRTGKANAQIQKRCVKGEWVGGCVSERVGKRLVACCGTCGKPCLSRRSPLASQGASANVLALSTLANAPAQETTFQSQQLAQLRKSACLQTPKKLGTGKAGIRARQQNRVEVLATASSPDRLPSGYLAQKAKSPCIGLCSAACQCWRARFSADPSTDTRCVTRPVRHLAFSITHSVTTFLDTGQWQTSTHPPTCRSPGSIPSHQKIEDQNCDQHPPRTGVVNKNELCLLIRERESRSKCSVCMFFSFRKSNYLSRKPP